MNDKWFISYGSKSRNGNHFYKLPSVLFHSFGLTDLCLVYLVVFCDIFGLVFSMLYSVCNPAFAAIWLFLKSQAYMRKQMRCLLTWGGESLLLSTVWKWVLTLLIWLSIVFSTNALLHSSIGILLKYILGASASALICVPFISHRRIYYYTSSRYSFTPPWLYSKPVLDLSFNKHAKSNTSPEIFQSNFMAVCDELSDYHHIYTDGSKMNNSVAAADVSREEVKSLRACTYI